MRPLISLLTIAVLLFNAAGVSAGADRQVAAGTVSAARQAALRQFFAACTLPLSVLEAIAGTAAEVTSGRAGHPAGGEKGSLPCASPAVGLTADEGRLLPLSGVRGILFLPSLSFAAGYFAADPDPGGAGGIPAVFATFLLLFIVIVRRRGLPADGAMHIVSLYSRPGRSL